MTLLLGPPQLCDFNETGTQNKKLVRCGTVIGKTENSFQTYISSGDAFLDFFFHVEPYTQSGLVTHFVANAWRQNPLIALKLICQLRGIRGTGKSDREGFYTAACWMHSHHPNTLLANLSTFSQFGYLKDLPEILLRILQGPQQTDRTTGSKLERIELHTLARMKKMGLA
ncbi:hypothetical protein SUGI_1024320 [Cryptomeria japonica]|nr:hypothetical protein SUGI_1024320 [Cryptomeria japonica]